MGKSINQYLGINNRREREDGSTITHEEKFGTIVNDIGLDTCIRYIPFTKEEIQEAIETEDYLNSLPIRDWESQHDYFKYMFGRLGVNTVSINDTVCTLKRAAIMWVEE